MGNTVPTASAPQSTQDPKTFVQTEPELSKFIIVEQLGSSKFMKTYRCKVNGVPVVVKVYVKRDPDEDLRAYEERIGIIKRRLSPLHRYPNVLPYQRWHVSQRPFVKGTGVPCFLIRQHFLYNLYDRISTRPFLSPIEKKWITYQLLRALEQLQSAGVCHGDIKTENVMVTSWNWVVLTDLASPLKPPLLPDDDPADFNYFFDSSGRRRCYLAPERLGGVNKDMGGDDLLEGLDEGTGDDQQQQQRKGPSEEAMDLFSMGCVIAEMYMDGEGPFDLPALLAYRATTVESAADAFLTSRIGKISDPVVHELCRRLMAREPRRRKTAKINRQQLEGGGGVGSPSPASMSWFPSCFSSLLYDFMAALQPQHVTPDDRILAICEHWSDLLWSLAGISDPEGQDMFTHYVQSIRQEQQQRPPPPPAASSSAAATSSDNREQEEEDESSSSSSSPPLSVLIEQTRRFLQSLEASSGGNDASPLTEAALPPPLPPAPPLNHVATRRPPRPPPPPSPAQEGPPRPPRPPPPADASPESLIIVAHLVCSNMRHLRYPQGKAVALRLLHRLAMFVDDESRLQRLTPYVMAMLDDDNVYVKVIALRTLTSLLRMVRAFPVVSDASIFSQYINPELAKVANDTQELVRIAFAESVAGLAETAKRFLDVAYATKQQQPPQQQQQPQQSTPQKAGGGPSSATTTTTAGGGGTNLSSGTEEAAGGGGGGGGGVGIKKKAGGRGLGQNLKTYDEELRELHRTVQTWVQVIAQDVGGQSSSATTPTSGAHHHHHLATNRGGHSLARRALLRDIMRLCMFFGQETTLELLIPILNTFFNDKVDWELRCALCDHIPSVCAFVGKLATEQYILPCIDTALVDIEERVIAKVLHCLATLVQLGLLARHAMLDKTQSASPLLLHPSPSIRHQATRLIAAVAKALGFPDADVFLVPVLRPYLRHDLLGAQVMTDKLVKEALQTPISRAAFRAALIKIGEKRKRRQQQGGGRGDLSSTSSMMMMETTGAPGESLVLVGGGDVAASDKDLEGILNAVGIDFPSTGPATSTGSSRSSLPSSSSSSSSLHSTPPSSSSPSPQPPSRHPHDSSPHSNLPPLPFSDAEEDAKKVKLIEPYLEACTAHTSATKAAAWHHHHHDPPSSSSSSSSTRAQLAAGRAGSRSGGGAGSDPTVPPLHQRSLTLSTAYANTISVPHQWSLPTDLLSSPLPQEYNTYRSNPSLLPDLKATYRLYGMSLGIAAVMRGKQQQYFQLQQLQQQDAVGEGEGGGEGRGGEGSSTTQTSSSSSSSLSAMRVGGNLRRPLSSGALSEAGGGGAPGVSSSSGVGGGPSSSEEMLLDRAEGGGADPTKLIRKVQALKVPPLPPDLGSLCQSNGQPFSYYVQPVSTMMDGISSSSDGGSSTTTARGGTQQQQQGAIGWRPKEGVLVGTLTEHSRAVNRLAVSQDFHFFASGSDDGTVKIWELRGTDAGLLQRSSLTYARQGGRILDLTMCDNSHSLASASSEGSVHVVRVDVAVKAGTEGGAGRGGGGSSSSLKGMDGTGAWGSRKTGVRVSGCSVVRTLAEEEGPVLSISHFNTETASLLVYATQKGKIHCWDLRTDREAWVLQVPVELGFLTSMALGPERQSWLCAGTNRGYILLWDLRFQLLVKVWRHSSHGPIHRMSSSARLAQDSSSSTDAGAGPSSRPLLFVAAGSNEVAVWDLSQGGICKQCFRSVVKTSPAGRGTGISSSALLLPMLEELAVPAQRAAGKGPIFFTGIHAHSAALQELQLGGPPDASSSVRAMLGRLSYSNPQQSYLITGSSDRHIRFWDLCTPSKCFTVSGLDPGQPQAQYFCPQAVEGGGPSKLFLCKDSPIPSTEATLPSRLPVREQRGPVVPSPSHRDAVLDLKCMELPPYQGGRVMLSCSRDETIKLWK